MFSFEDFPKVPQDEYVIYSRPYRKPQYELGEFEINFNNFPTINGIDEQTLKEKQILEEKIAKIQELNRLKTLEIDNKKKNEAKIHEFQKEVQNDSERKKDIENTNKLINTLENITADLTRYFLNYRKVQQNNLFDRLNDLMLRSDLKLIGENENTRSELISHELSSLKVSTLRKSKPNDRK